MAVTARRLTVDWVACDGHGLCHDLYPEGIALDDWGYPMVSGTAVPAGELRHARRAINACPRLALALERVARPPRTPLSDHLPPGRPDRPA